MILTGVFGQSKIRKVFDPYYYLNMDSVEMGFNVDKYLESTNTNPNDYNYYKRDYFGQGVGLPSVSSFEFSNSGKNLFNGFSGALSYSIPLFNLKSTDIEVPISLDYYSNGIKVDQVASWVGLGWSLNAGGCINRVMKSLPDELTGYQFGDTCFYDNLDICGYLGLAGRGYVLENFADFDDEKQKFVMKRSNVYNMSRTMLEEDVILDTEPDVFSFRFGKYSGEFMFDQNGNIHFTSEQNLKINYLIKEVNILVEGFYTTMILGFVITTPDGYKYTFGGENYEGVEMTSILSKSRRVFQYYHDPLPYETDVRGFGAPNCYDPFVSTESLFDPFYASSWHLTKIESPSNDYVDFVYSENNYDQGGYYSEYYFTSRKISDAMPDMLKKIINVNGVNTDAYDPVINGWVHMAGDDVTYQVFFNKQHFPNTFNFLVSDNFTCVRKLEKIITKSGESIVFETSEEGRLDLLQNSSGEKAHKLKYIKKYNSDILQKYFEIEHSYMRPEEVTDATRYNFIFSNNPDPAIGFTEALDAKIFYSEHLRLMFIKLNEYNHNGELSRPSYELKYNSRALPRRTSYKQDRWGYFNNNQVGHRLPTVDYKGRGIDNIGVHVVCTEAMPFRHWVNYNSELKSPRGANLESNLNYTKAGILEQVLLPTGGTISFDYQSGESDNGGPAGLALKYNIESIPIGDAIQVCTTEYSYEGGKSLAIFNTKRESFVMQHKYWEHSNPQHPTMHITDNKIIYFSEPSNYGKLVNGNYIVYEKATVKNNEGTTVYAYNVPDNNSFEHSYVYAPWGDEPEQNVFPFPPINFNDDRYGSVQNITTFNKSGKKTKGKSIVYDYDIMGHTKKKIYGLVGGSNKVFTDWEDFDRNVIRYKGGLYYLETDLVLKASEADTVYSSESPGDVSLSIGTHKDFTYKVHTVDDDVFVFEDEVTSHNSKGQLVKQKKTYPSDYVPDDYIDEAIIDSLLNRSITGTVLKQETFVGEEQVSGVINQPDMFSINYGGGNIELLLPKNKYVFEGDEYVKEGEITDYNKNGLPTEVKPENGNIVSVYYDEAGTMPLIIAENATLLELSAAVNIFSPEIYDSFLESLGDLSTTESRDNWKEYNKGLRTRLSNSLVKAYVYDDFNRVISDVDANCKISYYDYGNNGQLAMVSDMDNHIVEKIDYHYKNDFLGGCVIDRQTCLGAAGLTWEVNKDQCDLLPHTQRPACMEQAFNTYKGDIGECTLEYDNCISQGGKSKNGK